MLLFIVLLVYKIEIGKNRCLNVRPPVLEIAIHLAVAGDVFDGVFLCCLFPTICLG